MKIAKNYESINWQQCNVELFKLQNEILKAYRTGIKKDVLKAQHNLTRSFAARALAKFQKGYCPVCQSSLFNGEELEIHHITSRKEGGNHSYKNLKLLHKVCHRQVEYSKEGNLKATWREKGIIP
uniref:Reverse transcriptase n=1 Tax=Psammoneis japonica TaxID=517775 RepID=A0A2U9GIT7_9STRA|nr:reverse transcriptase [Psammoneis japonica]AWQ64277.1 reverse transcriptase [Psammoneis japonica]